MIDLTFDDLLNQLEQARQIAIEERKPTAMIQATATMARLIGIDKPVIKDVEPITNKPTVIRLVAGVSPDEAAQAYRDIMEAK